MEKTKIYTVKNSLTQISIEEFISELPELKNISDTKANAIGNWLIKQIKNSLSKGSIKVGQLLPTKAVFAYHLGVSIGTMQNALKLVEDNGYIEAKPCVGTIIRDKSKPTVFNQKSTSKRDIIVSKIKKYILENNLEIGESISSAKFLSQKLDFPANTVRLALENLCTQGILKRDFSSSKKSGWLLIKRDFTLDVDNMDSKTLVEKVVRDLKQYINENYQIGDKISSHAEFSQILHASVSTIHTAFKQLAQEGILMTRRGQYGTIIMQMPNEEASIPAKKEFSIFAPAEDAQIYFYEKTQNHIKKIISKHCSVGDKLPPITEFAKELNLSPNTVRKALTKLAQEGYISSARGRYGGTYVTSIPETESFKWLAVNPKYAEVLDKNMSEKVSQ